MPAEILSTDWCAAPDWSANPYLPLNARIVRIYKMVQDHYLFTLRFEDDTAAATFRHRPGQFVMLSVPGSGEAPISISSSPTRPGVLELCVRRTGRVTNALYRLKMNDRVGVRGPYGNGYPVEQMQGDDLLVAAGGLGMAPLRSLLWFALDEREKFGRVILMYGTRSPDMQSLFVNIDVESHLEPSLPRVLGDRSQLQQVFMNILMNAAQAMDEEGTLTVVTRTLPGEGGVEIRFTDTGHGIPHDHLDKIFDPFFTVGKEGEGTGLGLSIAYGIIARHQGSISVESEVDVGTTFIIHLPTAASFQRDAGPGGLAESLAELP